ncbi:methyltransferase domain-containing protein [Colletotrichum plurivorum]|uniref:Methyltransferase domain-containing protein n=1 Tax=Colletotrichum plurivorum TaxID=2175906 RepID=A0A8H6N6Q5_9PEZI|nr:methyltransferase domain-containing protein [Colletotrichum plurivorum]
MAAVSRPPPFDSGLKRWNPDDNGVYVLNRGDLAKERARLEYNHHRIWLPLCGGHLCPPHVLAHLRGLPAPRVAEVATGTGVWLLDMAAQLPAAAELRGIDMDSTKFPPASQAVPLNVSFLKHNALEPFPEEMRGTFDMVHVRLISLGMRAGDWELVARNVFALLKPGGWLHWEEVADGGWRVVPPSRAFDEWMRVTALWSMKTGRNLFMPSRLPLLLKDTGFVDVDDKVFNTFGMRDMLEEPMRKISTEVVRPLMLFVLEDGGLDTIQTLEDVDRLDAEMKRDAAANDAKFGFNYTWTWGRRP